jgi:hypothetical protein
MTEWLANIVATLWFGVFLWLTPSFARIVARKARHYDLLCTLVWLFSINRVVFNVIRVWAEGEMRLVLGDGWLVLSGLTAVAAVAVVLTYERRGD